MHASHEKWLDASSGNSAKIHWNKRWMSCSIIPEILRREEMKKKIGLAMTLAALSLGTAAYADCALEEPVQQQAADASLSADEQAFASKLSDQNRRSFCSKCSTEQRRAIMVAFNNGASADDAVSRMVAAIERKEASAVAVAEDAE
jgi:hypothetical protein